MLTKKEGRRHNSTYPKVAVQWLNQALCFYKSLCLFDSEVLRNRHLRVAAAVSCNFRRHSAMTKLKTTFYLTPIIFILGCAAAHFSNFWPYSQIPPNKVQNLTPNNYDDCLSSIDNVLSPIVKKHFKDEDSSIAVIELCEEIGGFFTTNWYMYKYNKQYHWPNNSYTELPKKPEDISSQFISDGIYHPKAMIRIMFTCYYKHLNNQKFSWQDEIEKSKILWPKGNPTSYEAALPDTIKRLEKKIISEYYFSILKTNDTVNVLFNRPLKLTKKSPDWYYLTGIITNKIPVSKEISVRLIDIKSEFNQNFMLYKNDTASIGDTITEYYKGWLSTQRYYFNYHSCKEFRDDLLKK